MPRAKFIAQVELIGFEAEADDADERHALAYDHAEKLVEDYNGVYGDGVGLVLMGVRETELINED